PERNTPLLPRPWPLPPTFSGERHSRCSCTLPKFLLVCMLPLRFLTLMLPSGFTVHGAAVLSTELIHWFRSSPWNRRMASLGGDPPVPGTTLGGTGWYTSVASGLVGSFSWAWATGQQSAKSQIQTLLMEPNLQFLDLDVPKGHPVPVVLYPKFSGVKGPEALPIGELGLRYHFFPRGPMHREFHDFLAIEDHMPLVGILVNHEFHLVPLPGRFDRFFRRGDHIVERPGHTRGTVLGIGMPLVVQDLDLGTRQIGLSQAVIFLHPPEDPTVATLGNVPFQLEHKVGVLLVGDQIVAGPFGPVRGRVEHHGPVFQGPGLPYLAPVINVPSLEGGAIEEHGPFVFRGGLGIRNSGIHGSGFHFLVLFFVLTAHKGQYQNKSDRSFHLFYSFLEYG